MLSTARSPEAALAEWARDCADDPLRFVLEGFPWDETGSLEQHPGPDTWQRDFLERLGEQVRRRGFNGHDAVDPIRMAVSKGHGVGGSVLIAWLVLWVMSTRPYCKGTVTANTFTQLETKTWATIQHWHKLCLTGHWFTCTANRLYHPSFKESWFMSPQSCREENSESFAGQHAAESTSCYFFDEDSAIPEVIHDVAEGGLTDGEPMVFRLGNATRNTGSFYECCFGRHRDRWDVVVVDSRTSRFSNKGLIDEWIRDYGEDSDFVRVRVRGLPPRASELQFIDQDRITQAQTRAIGAFGDEPLVCGVDFSGGGAAWNVVWFRRGADGRSIPPILIPGEATRGDRSAFLGTLAEILGETRPGHRVSAMFCDSAFGAPYVERLRSMGHKQVHEVNFGATLGPQAHEANQRARMWNLMKEWLLVGAIPVDRFLATDLAAPGYHLNGQNRLVLESKESMQKRGEASPDRADALALTFAAPVREKVRSMGTASRVSGDGAWLA